MRITHQMRSQQVALIEVAEDLEIDVNNANVFRDAVLAELDRAVDGARPRPERVDVVLDVGRIEFFDSAGLGALLTLKKQIKGRDGELVLSGLRRAVEQMFTMVGFDVIFHTFPAPDAALEHLHDSRD